MLELWFIPATLWRVDPLRGCPPMPGEPGGLRNHLGAVFRWVRPACEVQFNLWHTVWSPRCSCEWLWWPPSCNTHQFLGHMPKHSVAAHGGCVSTSGTDAPHVVYVEQQPASFMPYDRRYSKPGIVVLSAFGATCGPVTYWHTRPLASCPTAPRTCLK